jgi:DNA-binding IclR family transcriptional regulator
MKSERRPDNRYEKELGPAPFPALAGKAESSPSGFLKKLKEARRLGSARFSQENLDSLLVVGAVVPDAGGQAIAAVSGAVPRNQQGPRRENFRRLVTAAAERISRRIGAHDKTDAINLNKSKTHERCEQC